LIGSTQLRGQSKPTPGIRKDFSRSQKVINHKESILIGTHCYLLIFTSLSEQTNRSQLQNALRARGSAASIPLELVSPTPYQQAVEYHGYLVYDADRGGAFGTVSLAVHQVTAENVVIKKLRRNTKTSKEIDEEVAKLKSLSHVRYLLDYKPSRRANQHRIML
jgi:hypothetical protein